MLTSPQQCCCKSVAKQRRDLFSSILSICFATDLGRYLGFPLLNILLKKDDFSFIIEKLNGRLAS